MKTPAERMISGGHSGGETPVPIPNTAVKPARADGTWGEAPWESRSPPGFLIDEVPSELRLEGTSSFSGRRLNERPTSIKQDDTYNHPNARAVATAKPSRLLGASEPTKPRRAERCGPEQPFGPRRRSEPFRALRSSELERRQRTFGRWPEAHERIEVE